MLMNHRIIEKFRNANLNSCLKYSDTWSCAVCVVNIICSLGHRDAREVITFTFSILSNQNDSIPSEILPSVFTQCFQYAIILGMEETDNDPSSIVSSLTASAVCFLANYKSIVCAINRMLQ